MLNPPNEIVCPLCDQILAQPVVLSCCYSIVCYECIKRISYRMNTTPNSNNDLVYDCTLCKKERENLQSSSLSYFILEYIDEITLRSKDEILPCDRCDVKIKLTEIMICYDCCKKKFCLECDNMLHCTGKYAQHNRKKYHIQKTHSNNNNPIERQLSCHSHPKEKLDYICLKDLSLICSLCLQYHKQSCKNHQILALKEAQKEILSQLVMKGERLALEKTLILKETMNLNDNYKELESAAAKTKDSIKDLFGQLREILDYKEKELNLHLEYLKSKKIILLEQEIETLKANQGIVEGLSKLVSFAVALNNQISAEGAKALFNRIEKFLNQTKKDIHPSISLNLSQFIGFDDCKNTIYKLNIQELIQERPSMTNNANNNTAGKTPTSIQSRSRVATPRKSMIISTTSNDTSFVNMKSTSNLNNNANVNINNNGASNSSCFEYLKTTSSVLDDYFTDTSVSTIFSKPIPETEIKPKQHTKSISSALINPENPTDPFHFNKIPQAKDRNSSPKSNYRKKYVDITPRNSLISPKSTVKLQSPNIVEKIIDKKKIIKTCSGFKNQNVELNASSISCFETNHLSEINKDPLAKRHFSKILQSPTSLYVSWTHNFQGPNVIYLLEYGIGSKFSGIEQFRQGYRGPAHICIITDLMPKTAYRIRVCPIILKTEEIPGEAFSLTQGKNITEQQQQIHQEMHGEWSDIITISTNDPQTLDCATLGSHAKFTLKGSEFCLQFDKPGIVTTMNEYSFGRVSWDLKIIPQITHSSTEDPNSAIKIGVTNKVGKIYNVTGYSVSYGLNKNGIRLKICLDMENRMMIIYSPSNPQGEVYSNLPEGHLYPAFHNKMGRNHNIILKLFIVFDTRYDNPYEING